MTTTTDPYLIDLEQRGLLEWVPDSEWSTEADLIQGKGCRYGGGFHSKACGRLAVAALNRGSYTRRGRMPSWWAYCEKHLYGRRLVNGVILVWRRKG